MECEKFLPGIFKCECWVLPLQSYPDPFYFIPIHSLPCNWSLPFYQSVTDRLRVLNKRRSSRNLRKVTKQPTGSLLPASSGPGLPAFALVLCSQGEAHHRCNHWTKLFLTSTIRPWPCSYRSTFSSPRVRKWFIIIIIILDRVLSFSRDNDVAFFPSYNRKRKHTKIIKTKYCSIPHPLSPRGVKTVTHDQGRKMHLNSLFQGCRQWCGWSLEGTVIPRWAQQESVLLEADVSSGLLTQVLFHQQRLCPPEMPVVVRTGRAGVGDCVPLASSG